MLTEIAIRNLKPPENGYRIHPDDAVPGFGVRITASGAASFVLTFGRGRERITIGRVGVIALKEARALARERLYEISVGKHRPKRVLFKAAIDLFIEDKKRKTRPRTVGEHERILRKYWKGLHSKYLDEVGTHDITKTLNRLLDTPATALHAFWTIRTFFRWCVRKKHLEHSPTEGMEEPVRVEFRERVLTSEELASVISAALSSGVFGKIVLLLILTSQRRTEIAHLHRDWIKGDLVTLPGSITKNRREHTFPLSPWAKEIIDTLPAEGLLFPSNQGTPWSNFSKTKTDLDEACGVSGWTLHDLRRTASTGMAELGIPQQHVDKLLNHITGGSQSPISRIYNRYHFLPEMRSAVEQWEKQLKLIAPVG